RRSGSRAAHAAAGRVAGRRLLRPRLQGVSARFSAAKTTESQRSRPASPSSADGTAWMRPVRRQLASSLICVMLAFGVTACATRLHRIDTACDLYAEEAHCAPAGAAAALLPDTDDTDADDDDYGRRFLA